MFAPIVKTYFACIWTYAGSTCYKQKRFSEKNIGKISIKTLHGAFSCLQSFFHHFFPQKTFHEYNQAHILLDLIWSQTVTSCICWKWITDRKIVKLLYYLYNTLCLVYSFTENLHSSINTYLDSCLKPLSK